MRALFVAVATTVLIALGVILAAAASAAEDDDTKQSGCCFHFSNSPVTVVLCQVPDSCRFQGGPR